MRFMTPRSNQLRKILSALNIDSYIFSNNVERMEICLDKLDKTVHPVFREHLERLDALIYQINTIIEANKS